MFLPVIKPAFRLALKIITIIIYILTLISAFGGRINPEYFAAPSVLVLPLPYLAIASALLTLAWLCTGRFIIGGLGVVTLVSAWSPITTAVPLNSSKKAENPSDTFTVLSYNWLHGDDQERGNDAPGNRAVSYLINCGADIICLQEMADWDDTSEVHNLTPALRDSLKRIYPYWAGSNGVDQKVLSKFPIERVDVRELYSEPSDNTKFSFFKTRIKGVPVWIVNMHMNSYMLTEEERGVVSEIASIKKTKEGISELKGSIYSKLKYSFRERKTHTEVLVKALENAKGRVIVCGDFNDVPESYAYRMMREAGFRDVTQETTFGPMITYNRHAFWFHLDQIFYRGGLKALSVKKGKIRTSDHYPLLAEFEIER